MGEPHQSQCDSCHEILINVSILILPPRYTAFILCPLCTMGSSHAHSHDVSSNSLSSLVCARLEVVIDHKIALKFVFRSV